MTEGSRVRRVGALISGQATGWSVRTAGPHDPRLDRARGALLGLVVAEQQRAGSDGAQLSPLAATTLAIAEDLTAAEDLHPGVLARTIIDHALPDERYDHDLIALLALWERGVPVRTAASQVNVPDGVANDFAAAILSAAAIRHVDDHSRMLESVRAYAGITHAHPVGVDGAVAFAAALAATLRGEDPLDASCAVAGTLQLRGRLRAVEILREQRTRPGSLREYFDTGADAADAVATALFCATTAGAFAGALHKARCATGTMNAVQALTGALAGARFGCEAIPTRLLQAVSPTVHAHVLRVAPDLLNSSDATLR
jgi:poly(ADP-ribose) glycohydrolase ARH3